VFVRATWSAPAKQVLSHPKYISPAEREHFLWRDFYPILSRSDDQFVQWVREGFGYMGFTPPHPSIGELEGRDQELITKNRTNFAKLWTRTRTAARELGWEIATGSICQLYLSNELSTIASGVFIQPKGDSLQFRTTPRRGREDACIRRLRAACEGQTIRTELKPTMVRHVDGKVTVLDVTASLSEVLGPSQQTVDHLEQCLCDFVRHFLAALHD
jgi:hypothetical protein